MIIAKAVVAILLADTNITGVVGSRITPKMWVEGSPLPSITFDCDSAEPDRTMNGPGSLTKQSFEVTAYGATYSQVDQIADLIRKALDGKGDNTTAYGGIVLADIAYADEEEDLQQIGDAGQESNIHIRTVKFNGIFYMPA